MATETVDTTAEFVLSEKVRKEIDHWLEKFPEEQRQSAVLAALHAVQQDIGWLPENAMDAVADYIGMPHIAVYEVATFYDMYNLKPIGKHKITVCTNISCMLCGSDKIVEHLQQRLDIKLGETTSDGMFTLKEVECLAACKNAPMMQVDFDYHENLTPESLDQIIEKYRNDK